MPFPFRGFFLAGLLTLLLISSVQAQSVPTVIGARATPEPWSDPIEALGTLRADESITLSATLTEIIAQINFSDGEQVEAGQLLIKLEDNEEQAQLRVAQAIRDERRNALNRASQLLERNLAPRAEVEDTQARLRQAEAEIQALQARLANYRLLAPFSGRVGFRNISTGALVTPGMALVTLDKLDIMKLDFAVPEVFLDVLEPGLILTATSAAFPGYTFQGEIATIGSRVDPISRSMNVRAELQNPEMRLRPGMLMEVVVRRRPRQAIVIPEAALIPEGERHFVLVIHEEEENRIERRQVQIGQRRPGDVEVLEGINKGELVVSHGVQHSREGDNVQLLGIASDETSVRELLESRRDQGES